MYFNRFFNSLNLKSSNTGNCHTCKSSFKDFYPRNFSQSLSRKYFTRKDNKIKDCNIKFTAPYLSDLISTKVACARPCAIQNLQIKMKTLWIFERKRCDYSPVRKNFEFAILERQKRKCYLQKLVLDNEILSNPLVTKALFFFQNQLIWPL